MMKLKTHLLLIVLFSLLVACEEQTIEPKALETAEEMTAETEFQALKNQQQTARLSISGGLTNHFSNWLDANGYAQFNFERSDLNNADRNGSYGGKQNNGTPVNRQPVIFIHGNSDLALGSNAGQTGWTESIEYFLAQGYTKAELYATSWGPANALQSANQYHSKSYVTFIRNFIQAVKSYTGASKVDIITHSMGVTLTRKAIKGGSGYDLANGGAYNLGSSLTYIDAFVGIAGANWGLTSCYYSSGTTPTCAVTNGLYPGYWYGSVGISDFLDELNSSSGYEGDYVYSIWSSADQVIGAGGIVWGKYTCRIPSQNGEKRFSGYPYGHFNVKDLTSYHQLRMVRDHQVN